MLYQLTQRAVSRQVDAAADLKAEVVTAGDFLHLLEQRA